MRYILIILLLPFVSLSQETDLSGIWNGKVKAYSFDLPFSIELKMEDQLTAYLSIPLQNIASVKASSTKFDADTLKIEFSRFNSTIWAVLDQDILKGEWVQNGTRNISLLRSDEIVKINRPQEPKEPFDYQIENLEIAHLTEDFSLSGTLVTPNTRTPYKLAILISGSGPNDRDQTIFAHKPFKLLADRLAKKGIASFRYDERGVGESGGKYNGAIIDDFASDVQSIVQFFRKDDRINSNQIGLIGHSEGGIVAPKVFDLEDELGFIVFMAAPMVDCTDLMIEQNRQVFSNYAISDKSLENHAKMNALMYEQLISDSEPAELYDTIIQITKNFYDQLKPEETRYFGPSAQMYYISLASQIFTPWFRDFLRQKPSENLVKIDIPCLSLFGGKDQQVTPQDNYDMAIKCLKRNHPYNEFYIFQNANHLFQAANTGAVSEYAFLEETLMPELLNKICNWIDGL